MKIKYKYTKGFSLVELVVSISIFALMTALLLAKYGTFNQGILLNNLAYDIALTIRNAQSYGLNVKSSIRGGTDYQTPFGVHFLMSEPKSFIFFPDINLDYIYVPDSDNSPGNIITNIKGGTTINDLCIGTEGVCNPVVSLDIVFKRPDPNAIMTGYKLDSPDPFYGSYAKIELLAVDGSKKNVIIRSTGQISVEN